MSTPEGRPAQFITAEEAKAAILRCADLRNACEGHDGYLGVHGWTSKADENGDRIEVPWDWSVDDAIAFVDQAHAGFDDGDGIPPQLQLAFVESKYGRCLHVFLDDGRLLKFDTVVPDA